MEHKSLVKIRNGELKEGKKVKGIRVQIKRNPYKRIQCTGFKTESEAMSEASVNTLLSMLNETL